MIELNGSFYALQRPESDAPWYAATPPDFVFSIKGNRFVTHILRLRDIVQPEANVFASGVFRLGGAQDAAPASYEKHNPVNFASWWKTPLLVPHGEMDFRIPATQGLSTFAAL